MPDAITGTVFNIQRYTIHDGPGIRTELFMKGCPLSCRWCGNPEGFAKKIQPGRYPSKCLGAQNCGLCIKNCPNGKNGLTAINTELCTGCMECAKICPADAIKTWGREMTADDAMDIIRRDKAYYDKSGGGVTISGGEPLLQAKFVAEVFRKCREEGIHTCIESTLYADREIIESVLEYTDMVITDIKHMDSEVHREYTGVGNERILTNMMMVAETGKPMILRIPVIPDVNDNMDNMKKAADFIIEKLCRSDMVSETDLCMNNVNGRSDICNIRQLQLLSFMRLGEEKYTSLGMAYPMADVNPDREEFTQRIREFADYFNSRGINCIVGTKEKTYRR